jgi:hypothetical protein
MERHRYARGVRLGDGVFAEQQHAPGYRHPAIAGSRVHSTRLIRQRCTAPGRERFQ